MRKCICFAYALIRNIGICDVRWSAHAFKTYLISYTPTTKLVKDIDYVVIDLMNAEQIRVLDRMVSRIELNEIFEDWKCNILRQNACICYSFDANNIECLWSKYIGRVELFER